MAWLRRVLLLSAALAALVPAQPSPPQALANLPCDLASSPVGAVTGAVGFGNPAGDACNAVTDPVVGLPGKALDPLKGAVGSIGQGIFNEITGWVSEGAVWLLRQVVKLTYATTTPDLMGEGFVEQYRKMALIAALLGALMLLAATVDSLGRGDAGSLVRVFLVNVPLAAIATSSAYVVMQLLVVATDGLCQAITSSTAAHSREFFAGAIKVLAEPGAEVGGALGGSAGSGAGEAAGTATGATALPLFVSFIAAATTAVAAFFLWLELLARDAAIYVVALFCPLALAASIWPRWVSALRRTCELAIVVVFSKFVIVAILSLAASLLVSTGRVEQVLAAAALVVLACFSPFMLLRLVPFAEGAIGAAYSRQSAGGGAVQGAQLASSVMLMRRAALSNWGGGGSGAAGTSKGGGPRGGGSGGGGGTGGGGDGSAGGAAAAGSAGASGGAAAGAGAAGVVALPAVAAAAGVKGSKAAAARLSGSATSQAAAGRSAGAGPEVSPAAEGDRSAGSQSQPMRPRSGEATKPGGGVEATPAETSGGKGSGTGPKPPRPKADPKTSGTPKGAGG